jgi:hypothetical protein
MIAKKRCRENEKRSCLQPSKSSTSPFKQKSAIKMADYNEMKDDRDIYGLFGLRNHLILDELIP